jgi:hypothetical protein
MMLRRGVVLSLILLSLSWSAMAAPIVIVEGFLSRRDVPEEGVFAATVEVVDDEGVSLVVLPVPNLVVVAGAFSLDVDLAAAADALSAGEVISLRLDLGDGLERATRLGTVFGSLRADQADRARLARIADLLGEIPATDLIADTSLLAVPAAFANAFGVPAGIADDVDNGTIDAVAGLVIANGLLDVAVGGVTDVVAGSLTGTQIANGTVSSTQLGAFSSAKVVDGTLTGANFATGAFALTEVAGTRSIFKLPTGCTGAFTFTSASSCQRRACTIPGVNCGAFVCRRNCTTSECENLGTAPHSSTLTCSGTAEGVQFLGRLIKDP